MTLMISDALLDVLADEFIALNLAAHNITLEQFINAPDICRDYARDNKTARRNIVHGGRVDDPMKHRRYPRSRSKSDFRRRAQP
ncbi:MAG: hypothetical protein COB09_02455 [Thalassobium sp.]|nr:MAG: hypothetical protein COB09_02455 [Thalassobium sp.]